MLRLHQLELSLDDAATLTRRACGGYARSVCISAKGAWPRRAWSSAAWTPAAGAACTSP